MLGPVARHSALGCDRIAQGLGAVRVGESHDTQEGSDDTDETGGPGPRTSCGEAPVRGLHVVRPWTEGVSGEAPTRFA